MRYPPILNAGMEVQLKVGVFPYFHDVLFRTGLLSNTWSLYLRVSASMSQGEGAKKKPTIL